MARVSVSMARAAAVRANSDDWDSDSQWDDEAGPSWIKDYTGGVKHRGYSSIAHPVSVSTATSAASPS
jgi:hypothetical protein